MNFQQLTSKRTMFSLIEFIILFLMAKHKNRLDRYYKRLKSIGTTFVLFSVYWYN